MSFGTVATYRKIKSQTEAGRQALDLASAAPLPTAEDYDQTLTFFGRPIGEYLTCLKNS